MNKTSCPQCDKPLVNTTCRLVQDSCGHKKCRICLLQDEEGCHQCLYRNAQKTTVIKYENGQAPVITSATLNGSENLNCSDIINNLVNDIINEAAESRPKLKSNSLNKNAKSCLNNLKTKSIKKSEVVKSTNYRTLVIPNHIIVLKDPASYRCTVCDKTFCTKSHVKYHLYCDGDNKPYRCNECGKEFINKSHLEIHTYIHLGTKPHICGICNKAFALRSKLNRHKLLHGFTKPYTCQQCQKSFRSKDSLRIHSYIHTGEKPYRCNECGATFNNSSNLNKHLVTHSKDKVHMCDQCGKRFKLKWALTVHKRSHLRLRPHECSSCSKTFVNAKDLRRHELIHTDAKAYNCGICGVGFRRKDNLERHMRNTHPGKTAKPIKNVIKPLNLKTAGQCPVDNPNAIKVITASPAYNASNSTTLRKENTRVPFINAPLKLAFKTSAFKNHYNIHRDYIEPPKIHPKPYDLAESVNICQRILSPHSPPPLRNVIRTLGKVDEKVSTEICQKILSPFTTAPLHYETSFEHKKHAVIKNIKFKLPPKYMNLKNNNDILNDITPLQPVNNDNVTEVNLPDKNNTYAELKTVNVTNGATSVIVKGHANHQNDMHWRRRTSQNLCLQTKH